jgi:hypothetical protein
LAFLSFEFVSDFEIRVSDFYLVRVNTQNTRNARKQARIKATPLRVPQLASKGWHKESLDCIDNI